MKRSLVWVGLLALVAGCKTAPRKVSGPCPLQTGQPLGPFPNAWFEQPNSPTATTYQIVFPTNPNPLPETVDHIPLSTTLIGTVDGWSPSTQIIVWFPNGVDQTQLTPSADSPIYDRIQLMTAAGAPITLVDLAAKTRVPIFAEVDANANPKTERQALLIHPMVKLKNNARYAVAIQTSLHDLNGNPLAPEGEFADWLNGKLTSSEPLSQISDRLDEDATVFASLGITKKSLALAWDFDTASDASTTGQLEGMVATATAAYPSGAGFTATSVTEPTVDADPNGYRIIQGTFQSPSFESGPDPSPLKFDASGKPVMGALADWNISAVIPRCAEEASGPVPLLIVGHGLLGSAMSEISDDETYFNQLCMVAIAADWVGLTSYDLPTIIKVLGDPNDFDLVTDRLQQAHVNFQILTKLALHGLAMNAAFEVNGQPTIDTSRVYYFGISNGGIQGTTYLSLSQDVDRALLNVPGADWSLMMWRSNDFAAMLLVLESVYTDKLDLQHLLALTQSLWDKTDPIEFSQHLIGTSKQALFQQSIGDEEVTNIATEEEMRSIGANVLGPLIEPVYGMTVASNTGPLTGLVYDQWTIDPTPMPPYADVPPAVDGAHQAIRAIPELIQQEKQFLQPNGQVVNTCDGGPCNFPGFMP